MPHSSAILKRHLISRAVISNYDFIMFSIRSCWPVVDKRQAQEFRKASIDWLTQIKVCFVLYLLSQCICKLCTQCFIRGNRSLYNNQSLIF